MLAKKKLAKTKIILGSAVVGLAVWGTAFAVGDGAPAVETPASESTALADGRRRATLTYYAFHIAKLDATVSLCADARTNYRDAFEQIVSASKGVSASDIMRSYDARFDNFALGFGEYACPDEEVEHYQERFSRQIKNLQRDLDALK